MKSLVIVAHGSKREHSNNEVLQLMGALKSEINHEYPIIMSSFLEFASPTIPEAIQQCIQQGATSIKVLPYFLSAGKHVHEDIPEQAKLASAACQHINVEILPHLGSSEKMIGLMQGMIATH